MWTLVSSHTAAVPGSTEFRLPEEGVAHIVSSPAYKHPYVVREVPLPGLLRVLGRIVVGLFGVKVEAVTDTVTILPIQPHTNSQPTAHFKLYPSSDGRSESIFLRHGDVLGFSTTETNLTCRWTDSEVQVNSSAVADIDGVIETREDDTEDEDAREPIFEATSPKRMQPQPQPQATPQLSNQRSITIVQETPTTDRVEHIPAVRNANSDPPDFTRNINKSAEDMPTLSKSLETEPKHEAVALSTVRTGELKDRAQSNVPSNTSISSPRVQIPARLSKKRTLLTAEEEAPESDNEALAGPSKRAKTSDSDTEDSRLSNVDVAQGDLSTIPPRAQRGSQRSTSTTTEDYSGPTPRVACSNSTITKTSQVVKFLKKYGGAYVESIADGFNLLCVRDGDLQKTTKVLYAIACGIPIVTDQWLYESASAKRLLAVSAFKPSTPKQEEQWKLKLDNVLGQRQLPFLDYSIHFTRCLKAKYASFAEIELVSKAAGAKDVFIGTANMVKTGSIVLADDGDDVEAQRLMKNGVTCYTKDLFTFSILRGVLNLQSDEFKIEGVTAATETPLKESKKKRTRKST